MKIKFGDILIVLVVASVSVFLLLFANPQSSGSLTAVILVNGEEVERIELSPQMDETIFELSGIDVIVTARDGQIAVTYSDCVDQTCVHTGWLKSEGSIAVCLPNKVIVKVEGTPKGDIDVIAE